MLTPALGSLKAVYIKMRLIKLLHRANGANSYCSDMNPLQKNSTLATQLANQSKGLFNS